MALFTLQTLPTCNKFCGVPNPPGNLGKSAGHGSRQLLNSIPVHMLLGTETGERSKAKVLWACEEASLILMAKGRLRKKYRERFKGSNPGFGFCEGKKEWRCGNSKRDFIIIAGGEQGQGQSGYGKGAKGKEVSGDFHNRGHDDLVERQRVYEYEYDREVDGRSGAFIREEIVDDDRRPMRSTFLRYERERDRGNYQPAAPAPAPAASTDVSFYEGAAAASFDDRHYREEDIAQLSAPSARDRNGLTTTHREEPESTPRNSSSNAKGLDILDKKGPYRDTHRDTYRDKYREISGNFSVDGPPERPKSAAVRPEELRHRSNHRKLDSYLSNDSIDQESSASVSGQGAEHGVAAIEGWEVTPVEGQWMPGAAPADERDGSQNRRYERSRTSSDRDPERFLYKEESTGGKRNSWRQYRNAKEGNMLERSALYAKQVISQATARSAGVVAQLSVDLDSLKVVALEVRPNLLFGKFHSIRLNSLSRIGDVILIHNEGAVLEDLDLFNCYDLVGSDLFTESGYCLGKVRDYDFRINDGAVLSLEFDTFGVPLIPSNVISTYSLTADEVIEAQEDGLLVRNGAENRVRKLTKGLFSRPSQSLRRRQAPPPKERRKQLPQLPSPRSSLSATGAAARSVGGNIGSYAGVDEKGGYKTSNLTPSREPIFRERIYQEDRKTSNTTPSQSSPYESSSQGFSPEDRSSSANEDFIAEERSSYPALAPDEREGRMADTLIFLDNRRTQPQSITNSSPATRPDTRGLPMSYRSSKRVVEVNDP